ncbi:MAG: hypothetical protein HPY82_18050 [Gammaproteobacteria bacterium]|nr:hypothetical protein [Gammaproteobacteria bacterium]
MSVFRRFSYVMGLLFFVVLTLPGCKSSNKLENGVVKTNISGNASSALEFKFTLPVNVEALMIQTSANDQVVLQLLDVNKNPIPGCEQATLCLREYPTAGDYFLRLNALSQVSNLSLVASWSGPAAATLKNAVPVTGLKGGTGTVILQSLHIPFHIGELTLENSGAGSYRLELLDQTGSVLHSCNANAPCSLSQRFDGNYFVRITGLATFENLNLRASWGGANQSTLQNGIPKKGLSGAAGTERFESVYLQPGTQALMVQKSPSDRPASVSILDADGNTVQNCWDECQLNAPEPGLHYIRIVYEDDVSDLSVTAVWGGENESLLKNGVPLTFPGGVEQDTLLASVYLPEGTHALMLQTGMDADVFLEVIDQYGNVRGGADGRDNQTFQNLQPGLYFVRMYLYQDTAPFKLNAAWGSNNQGLLQNGVPLAFPGGVEQDTLLASVYIPEGTQALMLQTNLAPMIQLEMIDTHGNLVWNGSGEQNEPIQIPYPGLYFVRMLLLGDTGAFSMTATW